MVTRVTGSRDAGHRSKSEYNVKKNIVFIERKQRLSGALEDERV